MAAPAFVAGNQNTASSTTVAVNDPGGAGDFLLALLTADTTGGTWTAPDGTWVQLFHNGLTVDGATIDVWKKESATGSGSYTFTSSANTALTAIIQAFSGVRAVNPIDISGVQVDDSAQSDPFHAIGPSITTTVADTMLVWMGSIDTSSNAGSETWAAPSGYTNKTESTLTFNSQAMASKTFVGPGATGAADGVCTLGSNSAARVGYHIALAPLDGPIIGTQPVGTQVCEGLTANFTVSATTSGGTLHYQWKDDGSNVGTDSSSYTTGALSVSDSGSLITCDVSDDNGTHTSYPAKLIVRVCPKVAWFRG